MYRLISCLALCLAFPAAAAPNARPPGGKSFGTWSGTCNNLGACVAIGTASDDLFYVRIARAAGAAAAPDVKIVLVTSDPLKSAAAPTFALTAVQGGQRTDLESIPATADGEDKDRYSARITQDAAALAFIAAIRNATTLDYKLLDASGSLDLKGLAAALRWIDAQQGRAGTPTALVARGMTPIGQVPEPSRPPIIRAAPAGSVKEIAKPILDRGLLQEAEAIADCDKAVVAAHESAQAWRLGANQVFVAVPCFNAAYNFSSALFFTGVGGKPRPVPLPSAPGDSGTARNVVTNFGFDPKSMTLTEFNKGRGIGDCGETRTWLWTGQTFALLDAARLEACPGALPEDWPNTFHAERG